MTTRYTRGVWSLQNVELKKPDDDWVDLLDVWLTPSVEKVNHGYIGGGYPSANVDKLNFANDTKSNLGNVFPGSPRKSGGVGGRTQGYIGGKHPGYENFINKMVFATDAGSRIPTTLSAGRGYLAGCNSETNGYFVGGAGSFNSYVSIVDRITHATDTLSRIPGADLPSANRKQSLFATTASPSAAYIGGGVSPATTAVSKLTFSTEASAQVPGAAMITARGYASCTSNGTNTYWYGGATNNNGSVQTSDIDKTVFASDTTSNIPANMPTSYNVRAAATGNTTFGIIAGGYNPGPSNTNSAFKFTYGSESVATAPGYNLSNTKKEAAGISARNGFTGTTYDGTRARWFDGDTGAIDTVLFDGSNDYLSITGWDSNSRFSAYAMTWECWVKFTGTNGTLETMWENRSSTSSNDGFLIGRFHTSGHENKIEMYTAGDYRITTDVTVADNVWTHVAFARVGNSAKSSIYINGTEAGSFTDGYNYDNTGTAYIGRNVSNSYHMQGYITNMRFVKGACLYTSNFTVPTAPLTATSQGATESSGDAGTKFIICNSSDIEEGTVLADSLSISESGFSSNDSSSQTGIFAGAPEATPTASTTQTGVAEKGYIFGGNPGPLSTIDKLDMSTETMSNSSNLEENNKRMVCFGNTTTAYMTGSSSPTRSWIQKFVYSTDVRTKLPATLQSARGYMGGISNNTIGYTMGGTPGPNKQHVDKFVMSSETNSSIPNLPAQRYRNCTWGNDTTGYTGSGYPSPAMQTVSKITYSNDTQANTTSLSRTTTLAAGVSNATIGYIVGGEQSKSAVDKWTMSSDSCSRIPGANLPASRYAWDQANNSPTKGYFVGGAPGSKSDTFVLTFSSDSTALSPTCFAPTPSRSGYGAAGPNQRGNAGSNLQPNLI